MAKRPLHFTLAACAALFVAAFVLYWGSLRHPLVFDDALVSEEFLRAYASSMFRFDLRWFAYASFGWTYELFGLQWAWLRAGNIALHAATGCAIFLLMSRLFDAVLPPPAPGQAPGLSNAHLAFAGALLFVLHPVAVYGTAYLVQRSILMATLFSLVSLRLFLEALLSSGRAAWAWHLGAAAAFLVAAFSKEHSVMLPAAAAALGLLLRGTHWRSLRGLLAPLALLGAIAVLATLKQRGLLGMPYEPFAQEVIARMAESQPWPQAATGNGTQASGTGADGGLAESIYARSIVNQAYLFFRYLMLWVLPWPGWMSIDLRPGFPSSALAWPQSAGFLLWLAWPLLATRLLLQGGRRGLAGFGMLFPWLMALPEVSVVRVQEPFVLYRSYLWMGGLAALLPVALAALSGGPLRARWKSPALFPALALALACLLLVPASLNRLASFSDEVRLWDDAVNKLDEQGAPLAERTWRSRGVAWYRIERFEEAMRDFDRALQIDPRSVEAWMTRGTLHMRVGRTAQALQAFDQALALNPRHGDSRARRCVVLMRLQRLDEALADCRLALEQQAHSAQNHTSLGMVLALRHEPAGAEAAYQRALELAPAFVHAHYQYAVLLAGTGRAAQARTHFDRACRGGVAAACRRAGP